MVKQFGRWGGDGLATILHCQAENGTEWWQWEGPEGAPVWVSDLVVDRIPEMPWELILITRDAHYSRNVYVRADAPWLIAWVRQLGLDDALVQIETIPPDEAFLEELSKLD